MISLLSCIISGGNQGKIVFSHSRTLPRRKKYFFFHDDLELAGRKYDVFGGVAEVFPEKLVLAKTGNQEKLQNQVLAKKQILRQKHAFFNIMENCANDDIYHGKPSELKPW